MKLSVTKEEMQKKLANIQNVVEKKNTMPILSHFLLHASRKGSYIIATDIETAVKEPLEANIEREGKLCIPARKLFEIVREIDGEVLFEVTDDSSAGGWLKVKAGASTFKLACLPPADFPTWPALGDAVEITVEASILQEMIERTLYSAGESDTRYTLNGLLFHVSPEDSTIVLVGTDGHRLAYIAKQLGERISEEKKIIVPRKAVSEVRKFLHESGEASENTKVHISIGEKHLLFSIDDIQFLTRLIDGSYPNYENVIPTANEKMLVIAKDTFAKVLRRVSVMSKERASAVKVDLETGKLTVSSSSPDLGEAREEVAVDYNGDALTLGFNARYVLDVLNAMTTDSVTFAMQDALSPVLVKEQENEQYRCVIMPMRI
jgi:DNA polymerase-3 subunit beta